MLIWASVFSSAPSNGTFDRLPVTRLAETKNQRAIPARMFVFVRTGPEGSRPFRREPDGEMFWKISGCRNDNLSLPEGGQPTSD